MSKRIALALAVIFLGMASAATAEESLKLGNPAPKLEVSEFIKGEPVKSFEKGKVYVVEFWATWCGPCLATIPHVTELQKQHKDVKFVGVSIWEQEPAKIKPFVKEMGDKMDYTVAIDDVPKGDEDGSGGKMAKNWMSAAGENGIPSAFIINGEGKVVWIGHPATIDKPLEAVLAGKYDLAVAIKERKEAKDQEAKEMAIQKKLAQAQAAGVKPFLKAIDEILAENPDFDGADDLAVMKFSALLSKEGDPDKAAVLGNKLVDGPVKDNPEMLNMIAWNIVDPANGKRTANLVKLALKSATRADEVTKGSNSAIADTLAKAQFDSGDFAKAVVSQQRALKLLEKDAEPAQVTEMKERLETYSKAAAKK